jgi:uncharacterized membrane protein
MSVQKRFLSLVFMSLILSSIGCMQAENSSSGDRNLYGDTDGSRFAQARQVLTQNCAACHAQFNAPTEAYLLSAGYFVPNNPEISVVYYRLTGSAGVQGPKDMPQGFSLSPSQLLLISDWIQNYGM